MAIKCLDCRALVYGVIFTLITWVMFSQGVGSMVTGPGGGSDLFYISVHPMNPQLIYTGGDIEGIYRSFDGGATWENISKSLGESSLGLTAYWINSIIPHTMQEEKVYIATGAGLFVSSDTGNTWQLLWSMPADPYGEEYASVGDVALRPGYPQEIWIGLGDRIRYSSQTDFLPWQGFDMPTGIYRSTDGGNTWSQVVIPIMPDSAAVQFIYFANSDTVFIGTIRGLFRSDDGGTTWTAKEMGLPHNQCNWMAGTYMGNAYTLFLSLHTIGDPSNPSSFQGGIYRSTNYGDTWENITSNLPVYSTAYGDSLFYEYWQIAIDPSQPTRIYTGTTRGSHYDSSGLWVTTNADAPAPYWKLVYSPSITGWMDKAWFPDPYVRGIAVPLPEKIYITHVYVDYSTDTGNTWIPGYTEAVGAGWHTTGLECNNAYAIAFDPSDTSRFWVGYDDFGLFRTDDNGFSYFRLDPYQSPYWSITYGDAVREILVDPSTPVNIYVTRWSGFAGGDFVTGGGLLFSNDGGMTFSDLMKPGMLLVVPSVAIDFSSGTPGNRTLYLSLFSDNVYKSTDNGTTWSPIGTGMGPDRSKVWKLALDPSNPSVIYAGLNLSLLGGNNLLYKSNDGGNTWQAIALPVTITGSDAITDIRVDNSGTVYVVYEDFFRWSYYTGIFRSSDGGQSWIPVFIHSQPLVFDVHPASPAVMAVGVASQWKADTSVITGQIYFSTDTGNTWQPVQQSIPHHGFQFLRFKPGYYEIFIGTGGNGIWRIPLPISEIDGSSNNFQGRVTVSRAGNTLMVCNVTPATCVSVYSIEGRFLAKQRAEEACVKISSVDLQREKVPLLILIENRNVITVKVVVI